MAEGQIKATTTVEVIQELAHVYAQRRGTVAAAMLARDYAELLSPLLLVEREDLEQGLSLFEAVDGLGAFDAVLAAATMGAGDGAGLVSADRAFAKVSRLRHVFPNVDAIGALLA